MHVLVFRDYDLNFMLYVYVCMYVCMYVCTYTGRFIMYSGITKIYYRKDRRTYIYETFTDRRKN